MAVLVNASTRGRVFLAVAFCALFLLFFTFRNALSHPMQFVNHYRPAVGRTNTPVTLRNGSSSSTVGHGVSSAAGASAPLAANSSWSAAPPSSSIAMDPACAGAPDTSNILVIMKTGATEAYDKLPVHFMTTLRCVRDFVLFSDMEMDMAEHHLINVLEDVSPAARENNDDFKLYDELQMYRKLHADPRQLKGDNGWNLDKYKFLPMLRKTWKYREDADWYVFIEADTALNWDNLHAFLSRLDPTQPYFIGSPTYLDIEFAHGGTGYIASGAAMHQAVGQHPEISERYDKEVHDVCCGDRFVARVMLDEQIRLTKAWPMLNGENPLSLAFWDKQWCQPYISMHHMTAQQISQTWNFQQERKRQGIRDPVLWMDIFNAFGKEGLQDERHDWSNNPNDYVYGSDHSRDYGGRTYDELTELEKASGQNPTNCKMLCGMTSDCVQWEQHEGECRMGRAFTVGTHKPPKDDQHYTSGWMMDKIETFLNKMNNCSSGPDWSYTKADR